MIAEPIKINMPPMTSEGLKLFAKKITPNNTTKKGYIISIMEADGAPINFIPEKIKKLATPAKIIERSINIKFAFPENITNLIESRSINIIGRIMIAVIKELIKSRVIGGVLKRIFWSML